MCIQHVRRGEERKVITAQLHLSTHAPRAALSSKSKSWADMIAQGSTTLEEREKRRELTEGEAG